MANMSESEAPSSSKRMKKQSMEQSVATRYQDDNLWHHKIHFTRLDEVDSALCWDSHILIKKKLIYMCMQITDVWGNVWGEHSHQEKTQWSLFSVQGEKAAWWRQKTYFARAGTRSSGLLVYYTGWQGDNSLCLPQLYWGNRIIFSLMWILYDMMIIDECYMIWW